MDKAPAQDLSKLRVGFIGGGNMAIAIGAGLIKKGLLNPDNVWISARSERSFGLWKELGAHTTLDNGEVVKHSDCVFLAMKPQMLDDALKGVKDSKNSKFTPGILFISLLVGVTMEVLQSKLQGMAGLTAPRVIRAMPNTPMMVGEGITVYCSNQQHWSDEGLADQLFSSLGICEIVTESQMNAIGALSGSGPAYAFLMTEALADGAVRMGVPREMATRFAAQVLIGAGKMVLETGRHPGQLKDEVCSPGGTTITGVHALERGGVRASLMNAIEAAVNRSNELSSIVNDNKSTKTGNDK